MLSKHHKNSGTERETEARREEMISHSHGAKKRTQISGFNAAVHISVCLKFKQIIYTKPSFKMKNIQACDVNLGYPSANICNSASLISTCLFPYWCSRSSIQGNQAPNAATPMRIATKKLAVAAPSNATIYANSNQLTIHLSMSSKSSNSLALFKSPDSTTGKMAENANFNWRRHNTSLNYLQLNQKYKQYRENIVRWMAIECALPAKSHNYCNSLLAKLELIKLLLYTGLRLL